MILEICTALLSRRPSIRNDHQIEFAYDFNAMSIANKIVSRQIVYHRLH